MEEFLRHYTSFDADFIGENLVIAYKKERKFHLDHPHILRHIVRKFGIANEILEFIYNDFLRADLEARDTHLLNLAQILKYAVMHGASISIEQLLKALASASHEAVQAELLHAIAHKIKLKGAMLDSAQRVTLQKIAQSNRYFADKSFFDAHPIGAEMIHPHSRLKSNKSPSKITSVKREVSSQQHVVKTTQTSDSAEKDMVILSLREVMQAKRTKAAAHAGKERIPSATDELGRDRTLIFTTYAKVVGLYQIAADEKKGTLKRDDRDNYLPYKLLDNGVKRHPYGAFASLMIDVTVCKIFHKISQKQAINNIAIERLLGCLLSPPELLLKLLGTVEASAIAALLINEDICRERYASQPEFIAELAHALRTKGLSDLKVGFFYSTYKLRPTEIMALVFSTIENMQVDALYAIYYSVLRDKAILNKAALKKIEFCLHQSFKLKQVALKILGELDSDIAIDNKTLFEAHLSLLAHLTETCDREPSITFISRQAHDKTRCAALFNEGILLIIAKALISSKLTLDEYLGCIDCLDSYLRHSFTPSLPPDVLELLVNHLLTSDHDIQIEALKVILLSVEKTKTLPEPLAKKLLAAMKSLESDAANLVVMIMTTCVDTTPIDSNLLAYKLSDTRVITTEMGRIKFITRDEAHQHHASIAGLTAQMIVKMLTDKRSAALLPTTIIDLAKAISSSDLQVRILSAKALSLAVASDSLTQKLDFGILFQLQHYAHDPVLDIRIYTNLSFVEGLLAHSLASSTPIPTSYFEHLSEIYVVEDTLSLQGVDFKKRINQGVLKILWNEIHKKQALNDDLLKILHFTFLSDKEHIPFILTLLAEYVANGHHLPQEMMDLLESLIGQQEYNQQVLILLCSLIKNKHRVQDKTLLLFADLLAQSDDKRLCRQIIESLYLADEYQDLPEDVFRIVELERAGLSITKNLPDKKKALAFIQSSILDGAILPLHVLEVLFQEEPIRETTYSILRQCVNNKQLLPDWAIEKLALEFTSDKCLEDQIEIFFHLVKNNQDLPKLLIEKLITIEETHPCYKKVLSIFMVIKQRGALIPPTIAERIMAWAVKTNDALLRPSADSDASLMLACVASLYSFLQDSDLEKYASTAQEVFIEQLKTRHPSIEELCLKGLGLLATHHLLSLKSCSQLFALIDSEFYYPIRPMLLKILEQLDLTKEQAASIALAKIAVDDDEVYLTQCQALAKKVGLLQSNFNKIHQIIVHKAALQHQALSLLLFDCKNLQDLPHEAIEDIILIAMTNPTPAIKTLASNLLTIMAQKTTNEDLKRRILSVLPAEKIAEPSVFIIDDKPLTEATLSQYKAVLPHLTPEQIEQFIGKLALAYSDKIEPTLFDIRMLECVALAIPLSRNPAHWQSLLIRNLGHVNPKISAIAFYGMKELHDLGYRSWQFQRHCHYLQKNIHQNTQCLISDFDTLAVLVSTFYVNLPVRQLPQYWIRDLVFSDWVEHYALDDSQSVVFYKSWLDIEKKIKEPNQSLALLHRMGTSRLSYQEMQEIIEYLPYIDLKTFRTTLLYSENIYPDLKACWLKKMLANKLSLDHVEHRYLDQLLHKMMTAVKNRTAEKLLSSITTLHDFRALEELVNLISRYDLTADDIDVHPTASSLKIKVLQKLFKKKFTPSLFEALLKMGWTLDSLQLLVQSALTRHPVAETALMECLKLLAQYGTSSEHHDRVHSIFNTTPADEWLKKLNDFIISKRFSHAAVIKDPSQLIDELRTLNKGNSALATIADNDLRKAVDCINQGNITTALEDLNHLPIASFTKEDILAWANKVRLNPDYTSQPAWVIEVIAVARQANFLVTGFQLTNAQIISCLIAFNADPTKGRLLQVATGEGKTLIISILAIARVLQGHKVDVITSSPVRAEEDAKNQAPLYKLFGITTSDNLDRTPYIKGPKNCYRQDIVYGDVAQFQFDTLRDEYSLLKTKAGRTFDIAIFDEVDSVLIDDSTKIAKLSSPIAGMDQLLPIYHFIWQHLGELEKRVIEIDGKLYLLYGQIRYEAGRIVLCYEKDGTIAEIPDLKQYLKTATDISDVGQAITDDIERFFKKTLSDYIHQLIDKGIITCPANFKAYVDRQMPKWVQNAITALMEFHENIHYIIEDGQIKPVAYNSNGTVQSSTSWSDGLHQFLQLKHELKMTPETFTTNFLSNHAYFKRYKPRLFGLTGTLGSEASQQVLKRIYSLDLVHIPSTREKQYCSFETTLADGDEAWLEAIYQDTLAEIKKGRGVLIICQTIKDVARIERFIKSNYFSALIKTYVVNNQNQEKAVEKIGPGEIIIATNLAGRGTDIKTDAVEKAGGMHVIVTYLPDNQRVEDQAFGRTARQGKLGSGRKILNKRGLVDDPSFDAGDIERVRDKLEACQLDEFQLKELKIIEAKDALFQQFCSLIKQIRLAVRKKSQGFLLDAKTTLESFITDMEPGAYESAIVAAVEEQWALFLRKIDDGLIGLDAIDTEYKAFEKTILTAYESGTVVENACHHIAIANDLIINESCLDSFYDEAIGHCDAAIKKDPAFSAAAYVAKAWLVLKHKKSSSSKGYKEDAMLLFVEAKKLLANEIAYIKAMQVLLNEQGANSQSDLVKQLSLKSTLLGSYLNYIDSAIRGINKSRRLMTIQASTQYQATTKIHPNYHETLAAESTTLFDFERGTPGADKVLKDDARSYSIEFNDLTVHYDTLTVDQALNTIANAYSGEHALAADANKINITLTGIDLRALHSLLQPTFKISQLDKDHALNILKERASLLTRLSRGLWADTATMVDLTFVSDETGASTDVRVSVAKAQELITKQSDAFHYHLTFPNQYESLKPFSATFLTLTRDELDDKFSKIHAANVDLEIMGSKADLLALLDSTDAEKIELIAVDSTPREAKTLYREAAVAAIKACDKEPVVVKLKNLTPAAAKTIGSACKSVEVRATFNDINLATSLAGLDSGVVDARWSGFTIQKAQTLIPLLRAEQLDFILGFDHLTHDQAKAIIKKADVTQEDVKISRVRQLKDLFLGCGADAELADLDARGLQYTLELNELNFVPWRSVCIVAALSAIQIAAGATLIATGFGATVGVGLITEGVADLFTAFRAYQTRSFSWSDYCKQKAVSLIISAVCMGLQALKDAGKGVQTAYSALSQSAAEQAGAAVATQGKPIQQIITTSAKELRVLALKQVGVSVGEASAREVLSQAADSMAHFCFEQYRPHILKSIRDQVSMQFSDTPGKRVMRRMLAIDALGESNVLQRRIEYYVKDIMNPKHSFWRKQWDSIGLPLCKGLLSASQYFSSASSIAFRLHGIFNGTSEIITAIDNLQKQLSTQLSKIEAEMLSLAPLLQEYCSLTPAEAASAMDLLEKNGIIDKHETIIKLDFKSLDFGALTPHKDKIIAFLTRFHTAYEHADTSPQLTLIADTITDHVIRTAETQLISPVTSFCAASLTSTVSTQIQTALIKHQHTGEIREVEGELIALAGKENKDAADLNRLAELTFDREELIALRDGRSTITYTEEITRVATAHNIAYCQREMVMWAQKSATRGDEAHRRAESIAKEIARYAHAMGEDEAANLSDMMLMAAQNGIKLKVVNSPGYHLTEEDIKTNTQVVVFSSSSSMTGESALGHWSLLGADGAMVDIESEGNDCGYAIFSHLTGKPIKALRDEAAAAIMDNPQDFHHALQAQDWLASHYPTYRHELLFEGAKEKAPKYIHLGELGSANDAFNAANAVYYKKTTAVGDLERIDYQKANGVNTAIGVYRNRKTGEIFVAFEGTDGIVSWIDNVPILLGGHGPICLNHCNITFDSYLKKIKERYPEAKMTLTGHSKGALLASVVSDRYGIPAIVFDNPGTAIDGFTFSNVISIQSTPNFVNGWKYQLEYTLETGAHGTSFQTNGIKHKKYGKVIELSDDAGRVKKFFRRCIPVAWTSHYIDEIANLIEKFADNRKKIAKGLAEFNRGHPSMTLRI